MTETESYVTASDVTLPPTVPPLSLSTLDDVLDDDAFASTRRSEDPQDLTTDRDSGLPDEGSTARDGDVPRKVKRQKSFNRRRKKKSKSTGDVEPDEDEADSRRKSRVIKRSESLDSVVKPSNTSHPILKRVSASDLYSHDRPVYRGSLTDRPQKVSLVRKVSFKGGYTEPPTPVSTRKKRVSFGSSPRDSGAGLDQPDSGRGGGKGPMRRRQSMMNMLRSELMKNNKLKLPERPGLGKDKGQDLDVRREKSSEEIMWSTRVRQKPPLQKRQSMPALTRKESERSMAGDDDLSTFDRKKLALLTSLDKMGVKLPKRTVKLSNEEAEVLKRTAKLERHGSLTSRTVMANFDVKPAPLKQAPQEESPRPKLDDVTRSKLQHIFDTMTKEDASVTALPGLVGRKRHSITENEIAGSTAGVFLSRLRRRKDAARTPSTVQLTARAQPGVRVSCALTSQSQPSSFKKASGKIHKADGECKLQPRPENTKVSHILAALRAKTYGNEDDPLSLNSASSRKSRAGRRETGDGNSETSHANDSLETPAEPGRSSGPSSDKLQSSEELKAPAAKPVHEVVVVKSPEPQSSSKNNNDEDVGVTTLEGKDPSLSRAKAFTSKAESSPLSAKAAITSRIRQMQALAKLRTAVFSRTRRPPTNAASLGSVSRRRRVACSSNNANGTSSGSFLHSDWGAAVASGGGCGGGHLVSMTTATTKRHRRLLGVCRVCITKRTSNRFKNLAKFVCLLLRAWRVHSMAVNALLEFVHTVDVTLDGQGKDGLLFDITEYKADTEARLSSEAIRILKKRPAERTPEEIHYVQVALWNYKSLAEYPVHMQKMIAERAWFESYGARRVIVREGQLPMCFYFVLSGSALVSVMDLDRGVAKTIMYYNRGDSFGELAIMNNSRRQSTVISKDSIQLLVLTDTDFVEVFMSGGLKNPNDPFLSSLSYLDGWPKEKLSENPKKANYSYYKRGTVLAADSHNNDWIFIVKSGSISLLKKLKYVDPRKAMVHRAQKSFDENLRDLVEEEFKGMLTHEDRVEDMLRQKQEQVERLGHLQRFYALPQIFVDTNEGYNEMKRQHDEFTELHGVSALHAREMAATAMSTHLQVPEQPSRGASSVSLERQGTGSGTPLDQKKLSSLVKKGPYMSKTKPREGSTVGEDNAGMESRKNTSLSAMFRDTMSSETEQSEIKKPSKPPPPVIYVNVQTLTKGMVFGLSDLFFDNQPSMTLVSNGAECISISKKLFMEHASHAFVTRIREDIYPYPTEEDLQENLESQIVWDFHRRQVVTHVVQDMKWNRSDKNDARINISQALGY